MLCYTLYRIWPRLGMLGILTGLTCLLPIPVGSQGHLRGEEPDGTVKTTQPAKDRLAEIRKSLFTGGRSEANKVAEELKILGQSDLSPSDRETWVRIARDTALRQGDRTWLEQLKDVPDTFGMDMIYTVLLASSQLSRAQLSEAKATLAKLPPMERINEREKRRIHSIRARIAQLENQVAEEREEINHLVDHLYLWPKPICQSCHSNPTDPKAIPQMPITNLWFGERFVELLRQQGDADKVKRQAEEKLAKSPADEKARIRLAFALMALNQEKEAEKAFRDLPWAAFPDRDLKKPRMMTTFP